jgi:pantetheine-phosphate adenylyltransferase
MCKGKSVILPGSYDPPTLGHLAVIEEALRRYERVFAVIFVNPDKKYTFSTEERLEMLRLAASALSGVSVDCSDGLVIDYMRQKGICEIFKGYRNDCDLEYEKKQAEWNFQNGGYETVLWKCPEDIAKISSSAVRESLLKGEMPYDLLPLSVAEYISSKIKKP